MAQKFLSIRQSDFERIQSKRENAPWIRLHRALFRDPDFLNLSTHHRYLYTGLLQLAYDTGNRIYNDSTYLGQMLYVSHTEIDLKPLYRSGLLETTNLSRVLSESEQNRTEQSRAESADAQPPTQPKVATLPRKKVGIPVTFPETFTFTKDLKEWALEEGCREPFVEFEQFRDKAKAEGKLYIDWEAAFRTWIRNSVKWAREKANGKVLQNVR